MSEGYSVEVYKVPAGQRRAGLWSFRLNGAESLYYSTERNGVERTIRALLFGVSPVGPNTVRIEALRAGADVQKSPDDKPAAPKYYQLPTLEERVKAFMTRGKLGTS